MSYTWVASTAVWEYEPSITGTAAFFTTFAKTLRFVHNDIPLHDGTKHMLPRKTRILFGSWSTSEVLILAVFSWLTGQLVGRFNEAPV